jgi:RNA polymerase sigma factor (sigma-70 family)
MELVLYDPPPEGRSKSLQVAEATTAAWPTLADHTRSFTEFYMLLHARLVDFAEGSSLNRDDALDAVGDAMASLWRRWPTLSDEQRTELYAFGAVTKAIRAFKRKQRRVTVSLDAAAEELDQYAVRPDFAFEETPAAAMEALYDATMARMSTRRREVYVLLYEQSLSYQGAADVLGIRYETVHTHARLASRYMRAAFSRAGFRLENLKTRYLSAPKGGDTND